MNIGDRIAQSRIMRSWTQELTAAKLGISRASLSHYEKNRREVSNELLAKFADLYEVTIDYLVGRTLIPKQVLSEEVRVFVDRLDLADEQLLSKYSLALDGRLLTPEETKHFITFIRARRSSF
ncbi:helix-turn-helix domain-containing protein [Paenibacillus harenae]|uniref:Transcriptional regulator with XRE-family HTH domain n=1 Tax=Paenibacillus harenae TaxID=306543 RepID=A0ABT9U6G2_PAEHA|nr:helix-turn-helix transcriptional regulator [Paenibacillus harenae]MDQ0115213.1 transcriptional regulator with XRE-family HTH domain [Paenibacillus harenae]